MNGAGGLEGKAVSGDEWTSTFFLSHIIFS
jgi:hypothetical protein